MKSVSCTDEPTEFSLILQFPFALLHFYFTASQMQLLTVYLSVHQKNMEICFYWFATLSTMIKAKEKPKIKIGFVDLYLFIYLF